MKCPMEGQTLVAGEYETEIVVETCPECGGVWLEAGELERIQDTLERDYSEDLGQMPETIGLSFAMGRERHGPDRDCPRCSRPMERKPYGFGSQVLMSACPHCEGIWLDARELESLEVFFERSRQETDEIRSGFFGSLLSLFERPGPEQN